MTSPTSLSPGSESSNALIYTPSDSNTHSPLPPRSTSPRIQSNLRPPRAAQTSQPSEKRQNQSVLFDSNDPLYPGHSDSEDEHNPTDDMPTRPPLGSRPFSHDALLKEQSMSPPQSYSSQPRGRHSRTHSYSSQTEFNARRATFRSRSPKSAPSTDQARQKYLYATFFLLVSLVSFVVQTETAFYIQHTLHWNKAYCMLWLTHSSWSFLYPTQLLILRLRSRKLNWSTFWRSHRALLTSTAQIVEHQDLAMASSRGSLTHSPWPYMLRTTAGVTIFLTVAGGSWYLAVDLTTPSDLTAIYNCSAFFAYVFSILLLNDKIRFDKVFSVALAIIGVLIVAYGDELLPKHGSHSGGSTNPSADPSTQPDKRALGNLVIGIGSVMYGLYEVLYKKYACPPDGTSPTRGMVFANTFGSMIGLFTFTVLWIPIPILNYYGLETFEMPRGKTAALLAISTLSNAVFSGSFLVLMSLTSPVLSSVAALLTIFLVAITDWFLTGQAMSFATISGGLLIVVAFAVLSWATWREMVEEERRGEKNEFDVGDAMEEDRLMEDDEEASELEDELGRNRSRRSMSLQ